MARALLVGIVGLIASINGYGQCVNGVCQKPAVSFSVGGGQGIVFQAGFVQPVTNSTYAVPASQYVAPTQPTYYTTERVGFIQRIRNRLGR